MKDYFGTLQVKYLIDQNQIVKKHCKNMVIIQPYNKYNQIWVGTTTLEKRHKIVGLIQIVKTIFFQLTGRYFLQQASSNLAYHSTVKVSYTSRKYRKL